MYLPGLLLYMAKELIVKHIMHGEKCGQEKAIRHKLNCVLDF